MSWRDQRKVPEKEVPIRLTHAGDLHLCDKALEHREECEGRLFPATQVPPLGVQALLLLQQSLLELLEPLGDLLIDRIRRTP